MALDIAGLLELRVCQFHLGLHGVIGAHLVLDLELELRGLDLLFLDLAFGTPALIIGL